MRRASTYRNDMLDLQISLAKIDLAVTAEAVLKAGKASDELPISFATCAVTAIPFPTRPSTSISPVIRKAGYGS